MLGIGSSDSTNNGASGGGTAAAGIVSLPSPQFAALCAQLDPPDGLLLGSRDLESRTVRTDQAEASTLAKRRYRVVSLAPLPRLTVAGAASAARAAADAAAGAPILGWYRRRIGDCLRPEQQPQLVQLSAKEAHIHRRLCTEFELPDLLLVLVQHARDATTQALVTDTTVVQLHPGAPDIGSIMECLPLEVLPVCRTHLAQRSSAAAGAKGSDDGGDGSCDTVQALRSADRLRCGHLAADLAGAADAGFAESQAALEALAELLAKPPKSACGGSSGGNGKVLADLEQAESPVF